MHQGIPLLDLQSWMCVYNVLMITDVVLRSSYYNKLHGIDEHAIECILFNLD